MILITSNTEIKKYEFLTPYKTTERRLVHAEFEYYWLGERREISQGRLFSIELVIQLVGYIVS
jgi:hypothetical protein